MIISAAALVLNVYGFRLDPALPRIAAGALVAAYPDSGVQPVLDFLEDSVLVYFASLPEASAREHDLLSAIVGGLRGGVHRVDAGRSLALVEFVQGSIACVDDDVNESGR